MAEITKEHAENIATKLGAKNESKKGSEHDEMVIYYEGCFVARFGIRRGSKKNSGHDHVQKNLNVTPRFAKELATCTKSDREYFEKVGVIKPPDSLAATPVLPDPKRPWERDWVAIQEAEAKGLPIPESGDEESGE